MRNFNLKELLEFNPEQGIIFLKDNQMILFHDIALDYLKDELIRTLGKNLARGVLTRFGYRCGYHDAKIIADTYGNEIRFLSLGPIMHRWRGIGNVLIDGKLEFCRETGHYLLKGKWENSLEAEHHVGRYGKDKQPVCWISAGYASGFASGFTGMNVICDELTCVGKGDAYCSWELRSVKSWGTLADEKLRFYEVNFISKNLQTMLAEDRSIDIHRRLSQLVLEGHGIDVIAGTLSEIVKCPVIILNKNLDVIAGCNNENIDPEQFLSLKNYLREIPQQDNFMQLAAKIQYPTETGAKHTFFSSPILGGGKFWGYVVVYETMELSELEMVAIEHACTVCAMDNLKHDAAIEIELRLKGDLLDDIFSMDQGTDIDLVNKALRLGCNLSRPHRVMVVDIVGGSGKKSSNFSPEFVVEIVKSGVGTLVETMNSDSLVAVRRNRIVIILCTDGTGIHSDIAKLIQERVTSNTPECSVNVTWGRECLKFADYKSSFEDAWQAADILKNLSIKNESYGFDELGIYALLWESNNKERIREFALSKLGCLLEYDGRHNINLLKTLEIYLQKNCNLKETAAAVYIHINSLKYRLSRIEQLTGLDLSDEEDRFQCQLTLRLLKTLNQ